ncbi:MAG: sigma-70 family RNA polymerase sigma factor [Emergencia sp.]|uniref:hypothetical protein n=1 Tax=Senimuribacter intestinalis TaxID=2941507 RepID=UPI00203F2755|nr:hypothetical protein [Senimuribacter intestinalis]MCI9475014.1 sigma-70 family RNA polymerase sigma factor [Emergencia sp.]
MIEQYYHYDTAKLLAEYNHNKAVLKSLREQYNALDGAGGMDYSSGKVSGSKGTDALEKTALRRIDLAAKIEDYEHDLKRIDDCMSQLTETEQTVLTEFFLKGQTKTAAVYHLAEALHLEQSAIYDIRKRALNRFQHLIFG